MRSREYMVLVRAVEAGITSGWSRAHKHEDSPSEDFVKTKLSDAVLESISEWFIFEDEE